MAIYRINDEHRGIAVKPRTRFIWTIDYHRSVYTTLKNVFNGLRRIASQPRDQYSPLSFWYLALWRGLGLTLLLQRVLRRSRGRIPSRSRWQNSRKITWSDIQRHFRHALERRVAALTTFYTIVCWSPSSGDRANSAIAIVSWGGWMFADIVGILRHTWIRHWFGELRNFKNW